MSEIASYMRNNIEKRITQIEKDENVKIILAIESGSRAWGFESTDSDYDVRFIYRHPLEWYLNVLPHRDVIELPIDAIDDYSGWDIRKALFLLNKSNPVLLEWLKSPIVYKKDIERFEHIINASRHFFSPVSSIYHYLHMAKGNFRQYLQGDLVKIKKYFYVLRPLLACMWIRENNEAPPMEFEKLLVLIKDAKLLNSINGLLKKKKAGVEMGIEKSIPVISEFIIQSLSYFEEYNYDFKPTKKHDADYLNRILWEIVK